LYSEQASIDMAAAAHQMQETLGIRLMSLQIPPPPSLRSFVATVEGLLSNDQWSSSLGSKICFLVCLGGICPNNAADGHEEARHHLVSLTALSEMDLHKPYPNVAPDINMYCPKVLMMPFGPAPYRKIVVVPIEN